MGVDIVFFDVEDFGESGGEILDIYVLGFQYWLCNFYVIGVQKLKYGILLDMVGVKGVCFFKEYFFMQYVLQIMNKVWVLVQNMGYGNYFVNQQGGVIIDDYYYVNIIVCILMIDIINWVQGI